MRVHVGSLPVEVERAEAARFHRPLLLVHGLWTGAWIWAPLARYLGHRGWESWAPALLDADAAPAGHAAIVDALEAVVARLPVAPIVIAHDAGVAAALGLAARAELPAVVAVAPVVAPPEGGRGLLAGPRFWRYRLAGRRVAPPRGGALRAFLGGAEEAPAAALRPEAGARFRALMGARHGLPALPGLPGLVVASGADPVSPPATARALAARYGWEHQVLPARGHFPMLEAGWEGLADDVHRWIVRTLGAELLAFLDEEEER